jgi:hypothetical protein
MFGEPVIDKAHTKCPLSEGNLKKNFLVLEGTGTNIYKKSTKDKFVQLNA